MTVLKLIIPLLFFALFFTLCSNNNNPVIPEIDSLAGELPLLNGNNKIGSIEGFNPSNPPFTTDSMAARWQEALNAGMSVSRPGIREIIAESDVAYWNFYGAKLQFMSPYFDEQTENKVQADLQRLIEVSGDKKIVIQELCMHSGNRLLNSSEEIQRRFFELFFEKMHGMNFYFGWKSSIKCAPDCSRKNNLLCCQSKNVIFQSTIKH